MKEYKYEILDAEGNELRGIRSSYSRKSLIEEFKREGYFIVKLKEEKKKVQSKIREDELVYISSNMLFGVKCGLHISEIIHIIDKGSSSKRIKSILQDINESLMQGNNLNEAFSKSSFKFPEFYINLVKAGEESGSLEEVLIELVEYYKNISTIRKQTIQSAIYPIVLIISTIIAIIFMVKVPLVNIVDGFNIPYNELPTITRCLMAFGNSLTIFNGTILVISIMICFKLLRNVNKNNFIIKIPIIKKLFEYKLKYLFFLSIKIMNGSGIDILNSIRIIHEASDFKVYYNEISKLEENLFNGNSIGESFKCLSVIKDDEIAILSIGERLGELDGTFNNFSQLYREQLFNYTNKIKTILSPMMIAVAGIVILFVAIGVYLPIMSMGDYIL